MVDFEAGRLVWKLVTVGKQVLQRDQADAQAAFEKTGKAAADSSTKIDESGKATERASKKAREAKAPLDEQAKSQRKTGEEAAEAAKKQRNQAAASEKQAANAKQLSAALLVAGIAVSSLVGLNVAKFAEFDKAMSQTRAATMATAQEQKELGEAALDAGADTAYSASEAAAAEEELAKAGQSVSDIVGGSLNGALGLAAAGQLQVARSAEIMATTLTQFRLPATEAAHVADVLAAGAGKAQGSVDDLSLALSYVGPLAGSVGLSLDETAGAIAYFATQGIIGEKAGTSLRGVLAALQAPSMAASKELDKYGISVFDANGNMLSLAGIAEQLKSRLGGLTEQERLAALGRIFGNESLNAATLLYEGGAAAIEKWTANVNDSGYAAEQAAVRQDNLAGDIEKLGGAFDTALIRTGSGANGVLREMVQAVTALVDAYGEMDAPVQQTVLVLGLALGATLLLSGATVGLRAKYVELKAVLDTTNTSFAKTALVGAGAGIALTALFAVVGELARVQAEAQQRAESYATTLETGTNKITKSTEDMVIANLSASKQVLWWNQKSAFDNAKTLGIDLDTVKEATLGNVDALKRLNEATNLSDKSMYERAEIADRLGISMFDLDVATGQLRDSVRGESSSLEEAIRVNEQKDEVTAKGVEVTKSAAGAYIEAAEGASSLEDELSKLIDTVNEANGVGQDAISANIGYGDALAKVDETIQKAREGAEGYALTLDQSTQTGRDNLGMLNDLAEKAQKAAESQFTLDGNTEQYRSTLEAGRQALIDRATALGMNADEAGALADQIYRIPSQTEWEVIAKTQAATTELARFISDSEKRIIRIGVTTYAKDGPQGSVRISTPGSPDFFADGGITMGDVRYFAGGGVENRVAQMARAGNVRVWNEPETEGETYLPHAKSKRAASEMYLAQTAAMFGGRYIPASQTNAPTPASGGVNVNIAAINIPPGVTYAEAVSIAKEAVREGVRDALPGGSY